MEADELSQKEELPAAAAMSTQKPVEAIGVSRDSQTHNYANTAGASSSEQNSGQSGPGRQVPAVSEKMAAFADAPGKPCQVAVPEEREISLQESSAKSLLEEMSEAEAMEHGHTEQTGRGGGDRACAAFLAAISDVHVPREFDSMDYLLGQIPRKAQRGLLMQCDLILTCIDADSKHIAIGTNIGLVYLFDREKHCLERLKSELHSDVVTSVQLHHGLDYQVAVGMASGVVIIYQLPSMMLGQNKQLQKFEVKNLHRNYVTCVEWSTNGMKLFSGDKKGMVVCTEVDFYQGQCKSIVLLTEENAEIVQLDYDHKVLLVSTRQRSFVCRTDDKNRIVQVGQQERKVPGSFGACFIPDLCKISDAKLYATRPGYRIWKASIDGVVENTMIFKEFLVAPHHELDVIAPEKPLNNAEAQFGKIHMYRRNQLLVWSPSALYLLDPSSNAVIGSQSRLGYIVSVAVNNDEIFVLRRNTSSNLIRIALFPEQHSFIARSAMTNTNRPSSPVTVDASEKKDASLASPKQFFQKNILGKLKQLELPFGETKTQKQLAAVSVKQFIEGGTQGPGDAPTVTSPDLPPVVELRSPELPGLHLYADKSPSPSPSSSTVASHSPSPSPSLSSPPLGVPGSCSTASLASDATGATQESEAHSEHSPDIDRRALIAERVHLGSAEPEDIVFQGKKKTKKKKGKHGQEKHQAKEEDTVSVHSNRSEREEHEEQPAKPSSKPSTSVITDADEILNRTLALLEDQLSLKKAAEDLPPKQSDAKAVKGQPDPPAAGKHADPMASSSRKSSDPLAAETVKSASPSSLATEQAGSEDSAGKAGKTPAEPVLRTNSLLPEIEAESQELLRTTLRRSDSGSEDFYSMYGMTPSASHSEQLQAEADLSRPPPAMSASMPALDPSISQEDLTESKIRQLANNWAEVTAPANMYSLSLSSKHIWFTDKGEHIYYSVIGGPKGIVWKKASGYATQIAVSPNGNIVWRLHRNSVYAGTTITSKRPEGMKWVEAVKEVACIAVDDNCAWYCKVTGEVMIQKGLSKERPCYRSDRVECRHNIRQMAVRSCVTWAVTESYKLLCRLGVTPQCSQGSEWKMVDIDQETILFSSVAIGDGETGWAIDILGRIWFTTNVTPANPAGSGVWWQVPVSEYLVQDATALDTLRSLASKFDPQKLTLLLSSNHGGLIAAGQQGVWACPEYKNIVHVCRGIVQGYKWDAAHPIGMTASSTWKLISASGVDPEWGMLWAQQPNADIYTIKPDTRKPTPLSSPPSFLCLSACSQAIWGLTAGGRVIARTGVSQHCPEGHNWERLDLSQLGDNQFVHLSCNDQFMWAVDCEGLVHQRIGSKPPNLMQLNPVWLPLETFSTVVFTQIVVGPHSWMVWAVDNRRLAYARQGITEEMPIGSEWVHIPGAVVTELTLSRSGVWGLTPSGEILFRYGITEKNHLGNYWKKIPGMVSHISASPADELWAIGREGQLLKCHTHNLLHHRQAEELVQRSLSVNSEEGDWELV